MDYVTLSDTHESRKFYQKSGKKTGETPFKWSALQTRSSFDVHTGNAETETHPNISDKRLRWRLNLGLVDGFVEKMPGSGKQMKQSTVFSAHSTDITSTATRSIYRAINGP